MVSDVVKTQNDIERTQLVNFDKTMNDLLARVEGEKGATAKPKHHKAAPAGE
jgi:hypothetical protein